MRQTGRESRTSRNAAPSNFAAISTTAICRNSSFSSGITAFEPPVRFQAFAALPFAVPHAEIPIEKTKANQNAVEG